MVCCTHEEKKHWSSKCPKKEKNKKHTKSGSSTHITIELSGNCEIGKILMVLNICCKISQADIASIVDVTNSILLDCAIAFYIFSKCYLFSFY